MLVHRVPSKFSCGSVRDTDFADDYIAVAVRLLINTLEINTLEFRAR